MKHEKNLQYYMPLADRVFSNGTNDIPIGYLRCIKQRHKRGSYSQLGIGNINTGKYVSFTSGFSQL